MKHAVAADVSDPRGVSRETRERLERLAELVARWNPVVNLVAPDDVKQLWTRHIRDALQLVPLMSSGIDRAIDLGSGAGFPGLVLAIATRVHFDLIESDQRKVAFLMEAIRETGAPAQAHAVRIETAGLLPAPLVTARALAPLHRLLPWIAPLLAPDGTALLPKGANVATELTDVAGAWSFDLDRVPSQTSPDAVILRLRNLARVA